MVEFKETHIQRLVTERSRLSWAQGKMGQFIEDYMDQGVLVQFSFTQVQLCEQPVIDVQKGTTNANEIITYMKKRKYEEKSNALLAGRIQDVPFEKLNKTIDIYDMLKKQYEKLIDDDLVDSLKENGKLTCMKLSVID